MDKERRGFTTTRWSVVFAAAAANTTQGQAALAMLCQAYWYPVYAFTRRAGHTREDAQELTQEFFTRLLEKGYLRTARPERGRFRTFLLTSLRNFLANERDWRNTLKRGGGRPLLALQFDDGERRYQIEPRDELTPERIFERRWATAVLDLAMRRLETWHARPRRQRQFIHLKPFLLDDGAQRRYSTVAAELGTTEGAVRIAVLRLRRQFGAMLREVIGETVAGDDEVEEEVQFLLRIVGGRGPAS